MSARGAMVKVIRRCESAGLELRIHYFSGRGEWTAELVRSPLSRFPFATGHGCDQGEAVRELAHAIDFADLFVRGARLRHRSSGSEWTVQSVSRGKADLVCAAAEIFGAGSYTPGVSIACLSAEHWSPDEWRPVDDGSEVAA